MTTNNGKMDLEIANKTKKAKRICHAVNKTELRRNEMEEVYEWNGRSNNKIWLVKRMIRDELIRIDITYCRNNQLGYGHIFRMWERDWSGDCMMQVE